MVQAGVGHDHAPTRDRSPDGATLGATGAGDVGILRTHAGTVYDLTPTTLRLGYVTVSRRRTETDEV
jgi:hypothetical protein